MKYITRLLSRGNPTIDSCALLLCATLLLSGLARGAETNTLSIYLVAHEVEWDSVLKGATKLESLRLRPEPLLSEKDLKAYNTSNHSMTLTPEAAGRLFDHYGPSPEDCRLKISDVDFVLIAMGERIYGGTVINLFSSRSPHGMPFLTEPQPQLGVQQFPTNVVLEIRFVPHPLRKEYKDPRSDPRVFAAVKKLFDRK